MEGARLRKGSIYTTPLPDCAAVTALGEILNYEFDPSAGPRALRQLFQRIYDALRPGGLFLFDLATPARTAGPQHRHFLGDDWALLTDYIHTTDKTRLTRHLTAFRKSGSTYRRTQETHHLRLYRATAVATQLRHTGFRVRLRKTHGGDPFPKGLTAFLARKP